MNDSELIYQKIEGVTANEEIWTNSDNKLFRINGPASIRTYNDGYKIETWYQKPNMIHRKGGPAIIEYDREGNIEGENYYINGLRLERVYQHE